MSDWVVVGTAVINVDNIEYIEKKDPTLLKIYLASGRVLEITESMAVNLWNFVDQNRIPFYDKDIHGRGFSS